MGLFNYPGTLCLYLVVLLFSVYLSNRAQTLSLNGNTIKARYYLIGLIVFLSLFCGLRARCVGVDTEQYYNVFNREYYGASHIREFIFYEASFLVKRIFGNVQAVFVFWSAIINGLVILRFWDYHKKISFPFTIFTYYCVWYLTTFSGIRNWSAVAIVFFLTRYLEREKPVVYILGVLFATFIHLTAVLSLIYAILYFIKKKGTSKNRMLYIMISLLGIIGILLLVLRLELVDRYSYILNSNLNGFSFGFQAPTMILILLLIHFDVRISKRGAPYYNSNSNEKIIINNDALLQRKLELYEAVTLSIHLAGYWMRNTARLRWYFGVFNPVFYGYVFSQSNKNRFTAAKVLMICVLLYTFLSSSSSKLAPFVFFWDY